MTSASYQARRGELQTYFDRTAVEAWARLTSDAPVSRIRATVRAGRDAMRATLLAWLPADLTGARILDAGCGTGALSIEAARRGAEVVAIDLAANLVDVARDRAPGDLGGGSIDFRVGDMLDRALGGFDHVVAMDSLIHYSAPDILRTLTALAARTRKSMIFTFAPRTPALMGMHTVGRLFPRGDRAPAIQPLAESRFRRLAATSPELSAWRIAQLRRIESGFYKSQAVELVRA